MEKKRNGSIGDIWHGLLGDNYVELYKPVIDACLNGKMVSFKEYGKYLIYLDHSASIPVQMLSEKSKNDTYRFVSIFPKFPFEFENIDFELESIDEWNNEAEAVFIGSIFQDRKFSFFCQNYVEYKGKDLIGKKIAINISVGGLGATILPEKERTILPDAGPFKGQEMTLTNMRSLNSETDDQPEICGFFFPIKDIQKLKFHGKDLLKIKGELVDINTDKNYAYNVYIRPELIENSDMLKIGEPFTGTGWLQAEIAGVYKS